ncbi:MAG: hypothetical protein ACTHN2_04430 [Nitrobacter sp.]
MTAGIHIVSLSFTGRDKNTASLTFEAGLNVLFGASNTGKSFALKVLDFLFGGSKALPDIKERIGYESAWLALRLPKSGDVTLMRALAGGSLELYAGHVTENKKGDKSRRRLSARHDAEKTENVSQFLLQELGLSGRLVATDVNGRKRPLSFRDLARYCLIDETAIQSETSPAESGQVISPTVERSVFKLLLTGQDDSAVVTIQDRKSFKAATTAKLEVVDELIKQIDEELVADFPQASELQDQSDRIDDTLRRAQQEMRLAQESIRGRLATKQELARNIFRHEQRYSEIQMNFGRFEQLAEIYTSDIARLEAIEEAGFVLSLSGDRPCPLCGALPEAQKHSHGVEDIKKANPAANVEIAKIRKQQTELTQTIQQLELESVAIELELDEFDDRLTSLESELSQLAPVGQAAQRRLDEILASRDIVRRGLSLIEQRTALQGRREELVNIKPATKADRPQLGAPGTVTHEFAQKISSVLKAWKFPGECHVAFDESTYDIRIDGKNRKDNGKGVRAVTHAAVKVALMIFCRERNLPHPGFLVLDTPLLTYRDPLSNRGPLESGEEELRKSALKQYFFEHLAANGALGQFVVIENIDLPENLAKLGHVETFTGDPNVPRTGLFLSSAK